LFEFGFADTFSEARTKLRRAEDTSALDTDTDGGETTRKRRRRIFESNDEDDSSPCKKRATKQRSARDCRTG